MARPTLDRNPKYKMLVAALGIPKAHVRGLLEQLWDAANESGEPVFPCWQLLEAAAEWTGEPKRFADAVSTSPHVFVDLHEDGVYEIHDYWEHAPEYVKARRRMEQKRKNNSEQFRNVRNNSEKFQPPAPAPAPAPALNTNTTPQPPKGGVARNARESVLNAVDMAKFKAWYAAYPNKKSPGAAEAAWKKRRSGISDAELDAMRKTLQWQTREWAKKNYEYVPNPATYLNGKKWQDEPTKRAGDQYHDGNEDDIPFG